MIVVRAHLDAASAGSWASVALIRQVIVFLAAIFAAAAYSRFVAAAPAETGRRLAFTVAGAEMLLTAPLAATFLLI